MVSIYGLGGIHEMRRILVKWMSWVSREYIEIIYYWRQEQRRHFKNEWLLILLLILHPVIILAEFLWNAIAEIIEFVFKIIEYSYRLFKLMATYILVISILPWSVGREIKRKVMTV